MAILMKDDAVFEVTVTNAGMAGVLAHGSRGDAGGNRRTDRVAVGEVDAGDRDCRDCGCERTGQHWRGRRRMRNDQRRGAGRSGLSCFLDVLTTGVVAGHDGDPVCRWCGSVVRGRAAVSAVDDLAICTGYGWRWGEPRPGCIERSQSIDHNL